MKNQYFGDINDYLKYGMLRCISQAGLRIGVCWMLTPDVQGPDGRKIQYLSRPKEWRHYDPRLFDHLEQTVLRSGGRDVCNIEGNGHIPNAIFFRDPLPDNSKIERSEWLKKMLSKLRGVDLMFFDPDNGIEVSHKLMGRKNLSKYVYWEELREAWNRVESLLVFQHFPRVKRDVYIPMRVEDMRYHLPGSSIIPLRSSHVLFLLAYRAESGERVLQGVRSIEVRWASRVLRTTV